MAQILILGSKQIPNGGSDKYRGTYRSHPYYQENLDPSHEVNLAFIKFCEDGGVEQVISDIKFAREIVTLYGNLNPPQYFDVVEAVTARSAPIFTGTFLGYDVSVGTGQSLLCGGLKFNKNIQLNAQSESLVNKLELSFKPQLNTFGLFENLQVAEQFVENCASIHNLEPAFFWSRGDKYEPIGLYLI